MTLAKTLSDYFSSNEHFAACFMRGYTPEQAVDFMESIDASYDEVASYGGEDQGSMYYRVYCFKSGSEKVFIKFNGWYASHYGSEYQNFEIVTPKQRTITVYE